MVGTSILAPSVASLTVTGTFVYKSLPRLSKYSWGFTTTRKYKSPAGAPIVPVLPLPGTRTRPPFAAPAAPRARHVKPHLARRLLDRARSMARRARLRRAHRSRSVAHVASVQARDCKCLYGSAHSVPEIDLDLVFQVSARFVFRFHPGAPVAAAEKLAEEISETRRATCGARSAAEIKH